LAPPKPKPTPHAGPEGDSHTCADTKANSEACPNSDSESQTQDRGKNDA
jgi:hypothetical protein